MICRCDDEEYAGCIYRDNGICRFDESPVKEPYYQACKDPYYVYEEE